MLKSHELLQANLVKRMSENYIEKRKKIKIVNL